MTNELANFFDDAPMDDFDDDMMANPMDNFFDDFGKSFLASMPKVPQMRTDVADNKKAYQVTAELPGFKKNNLHLDYRNNTLRINAVHNVNKNVKNHQGRVIRSERSMGNVARAFYLPNVNFNKITASYDGGLLKINLPKDAKHADNRRINIK